MDTLGTWALADELARDDDRRQTSTQATVSCVDQDGTVWVRLTGADSDTPVNGTVAVDVKRGDVVVATVENGRLSLTGNASAPAVSGTYVKQTIAPVAQTARDAMAEATRAHDAADAAEADARRAHDAADSAQTSADNAAIAASNAQTSADNAAMAAGNAQTSATRANTHANDALVQLGTVQDVLGAATWIAEHGTYALTQDVAVDETKAYYSRTGSGTQADPYVYTVVAEPTTEGLSGYYELSVDEAVSAFVASHLALTNAGLYVLKDNSGYKLLCANDGVSVVDPQGHVVVTYGASIVPASDRPYSIGNEDAYILFMPATANTEAKVVIGGHVQLGSSRTLSDWESDMSQAVTDAATAVQTAEDVPIVTLSSTNGTVFKRNVGVSTTIVAKIFTPGGNIDNPTELHRRFGAGAYLQWGWRDVVTDADHVLLSTDPRIVMDGFGLLVSPGDVDTQAVITCSINY